MKAFLPFFQSNCHSHSILLFSLSHSIRSLFHRKQITGKWQATATTQWLISREAIWQDWGCICEDEKWTWNIICTFWKQNYLYFADDLQLDVISSQTVHFCNRNFNSSNNVDKTVASIKPLLTPIQAGNDCGVLCCSSTIHAEHGALISIAQCVVLNSASNIYECHQPSNLAGTWVDSSENMVHSAIIHRVLD